MDTYIQPLSTNSRLFRKDLNKNDLICFIKYFLSILQLKKKIRYYKHCLKANKYNFVIDKLRLDPICKLSPTFTLQHKAIFYIQYNNVDELEDITNLFYGKRHS